MPKQALQKIILLVSIVTTTQLNSASFYWLVNYSGFTTARVPESVDMWELYKPVTAESLEACRTSPGRGGSMNSGLELSNDNGMTTEMVNKVEHWGNDKPKYVNSVIKWGSE